MEYGVAQASAKLMADKVRGTFDQCADPPAHLASLLHPENCPSLGRDIEVVTRLKEFRTTRG